MGPPLIAAENPSARRGTRATNPGFNGAAAHRGGELMALGEAAVVPALLQWGRRSSRRRTRTSVTEVVVRNYKLQWGRRSSRRRTDR
jgi:hypothetical protein